jgi:membrane protease YdiL (CAAX protease family)
VLRSPALWVALAGTIACVAGGRVLGDAAGHTITTRTAAEILNWAFYIVVYGGLAVLVLQISRRFGTGSLRTDLGFAFRWSDLGWGPLLFIGTRLAQVLVTAPLIVASGGVRRSSEAYSHEMRHLPVGVLVTTAVVGIVVAPIVEELLFRGVLLRSLLPMVGPAGAAIVQGVLFGAYHFAPSLGLYNIVLITANGTFGIIFGFVALRRRSLGTGIVAHAITNATALAVVFATR